MSVRPAILNPVVNQTGALQTTQQVLSNLVANAAGTQDPAAEIPANMQGKLADALKNVEAALSDLGEFYQGYIVPNAA